VFGGGELGKKFGLISVPNNSWEGLRYCWISFTQRPGMLFPLEDVSGFDWDNE
jgi:hypothetical protein